MNPDELVAKLQEAHSRRELRRLVSEERTRVDPSLIGRLRTEAERCTRTDPQRALRTAEATLYISGLLGDPLGQASGTWAKANALRALGKYRQSLALYDQADRTYQEQGLAIEAARTQIGKIDALMYQSRYAEALMAAAAARKVLLQHGEHLQVAKLDANTGNVYHRMDRYEESLRLYDRARQAFARLGYGAFVAHVDVNRANILTLLNSFRQAEHAYLQARLTFAADGQQATVGMIDANLGFLYYMQGHYNRALERLNGARDAFGALDLAKNLAMVNLDLAEIYLALNLSQEAIELAEQARAACARLGMRLEVARAQANRAFGHVQLGQYAVATGLLAQARQGFQQESNEVWAAILDLHRAALLCLPAAGASDLAEALALCQSAAAVFRRHGLAAKHAYAQLVESGARESLGETAAAFLLCHSALRTASRLHLPWLLHQVYHALGRLEETPAPARARHYYQRAIEALESMCNDLQPEELRTAFLANRLQVYEDFILLSLEGGRAGLREAFAYIERAKSRALVDLLAGRLEAKVKSLESGDMVAQLTSLRAELNWFYNKLSEGETPGGQRRQVWVQDLTQQVKVREVQVSRILRQLQIRSEEYAALQQVYTCSLEAVQDLLDDSTTLIEYYVAAEEIVAFVVDRRGIRLARNLCSRAAAAALAERLHFHLAKFGYAPAYVDAHFAHLCTAMNEHLRRLYDGLLRPIYPWLRGQRLIIVPHGLLHYLPFHAFYDGRRYLGEDFEVSYSPSASVLDLCDRQPARPIARALVMGVADDRAPLVADEVQGVGALFTSAIVLSGAEATVGALQQHAPGADAIHIACHGVFAADNPMFSRFRLADGWVSVHDVYNLDLQSSLVTLSACETGLSRVAAGDELIGLARGFFYAGASSLLMSLWAVNDRSTASLMRSFYRRLLAGDSKVAALRGAQLEIKQEFIHPYHWAPFVLLGRAD